MANRFLIAGGNGNWNDTSNWSATTGGASGASFPIAGDTVALDSNSGNAAMTVNVASACTSLVMSGSYAGTLTFNSTLTLTSTCTFVSACTIAGTGGTLACTGSATLTSGGKTLTCALTASGTATYTLADNWAVNGLCTLGGTTLTTTFNGVGKTLTCNGGLRFPGTSGVVTGTAKLSLAGGTWDCPSVTQGGFVNNIDLAGNVTVSGNVQVGATTLTYVSGTITTTGSTLFVNATSTLNTAGVTWNNVTFTGTSQTWTFSSNLAWSGTLALSVTTGLTFTGAGTLSGTGAVTISSAITATLNNTGGLVTTGTLTLPNTACTFAGSAGFTVGTLTTATLTASRIHTLTFGNTYTVTATFGNNGTSPTIRQAIKSSSAGNRVALNVTPGAAVALAYCDPTDVNSSGGGTVTSVGGTLTNTLNWIDNYTAGAVAGGSVGPVFGCSFINAARA